MSIQTSPLTLTSLGSLPGHSRRCIFWELDPGMPHELCDPEFEKEAWLSTITLEWGSCGQVLAVDDQIVGHAIYAPPGDVPRSRHFPTSPVSPDAVLLANLALVRPMSVDDWAPTLLRAVVQDLVRRGVRAIESFGVLPEYAAGEGKLVADTAELDAMSQSLRHSPVAFGECSSERCMASAPMLEKLGFTVVAPHHRFPRLRLELDRDLGWKAGVEAALEQLLVEAAIAVTEREQTAETVGVHSRGDVRAAVRNLRP